MSGPLRKGRPTSTLAHRSRATLRLGFRLAARNAWRARGRSILIVFLVAIPVLGLTAAGTVVLSITGTVAQNVHARLGHMAASVTEEGGRITQSASGVELDDSGDGTATAPSSWVPDKWRLVPLRQEQLYLHTAHGVGALAGEAGRSWDSGFAGRFQLIKGHAPTSADELLVTPSALARLGATVGGTVTAADGSRSYTVVGTMRDLTLSSDTNAVFGTFDAFPGAKITTDDSTDYYLDGPPVTAADIHDFNLHGAVVQSRAVTQSIGMPDLNTAFELVAIFGIIGAFMLIEIALLSGAAFMVGARQQQRALAVLASVGADRRVLRASVASGGLVLGAAGALVGIGLGLLAARGYISATADGSTTKYYGFDVYPIALLVLGVVAVAAAWISASIPARSVSRFDIVAALRGARRPAKPSRLRSAVGIGMIIVAAGVTALGGVLTLVSSTQNPPPPLLQASGPTLLVVGSLGLQLGAILGLPALLRATSRWMARGGSSARLATRDLARNSARSVPAIAVIMSTAFVGVFLMALVSGFEASGAATYSWSGPLNATIIQFENDEAGEGKAPLPVDAAVASGYASEVNRVLGGSSAHVINGAPDALTTDPSLKLPTAAPIPEPVVAKKYNCAFDNDPRSCTEPQFLFIAGTGAKIIVGSASDLAAMLGQRPSAAALAALNSGGAVSLYPQYLDGSRVTLDWWTQKQLNDGDDATSGKTPFRSVTLPAVTDAPAHPGAFGIIVSPATAASIQLASQPRFVLADREIAPTVAQQDQLTGYIDQHSGAGRQVQASLRVETGPQHTADGIAWIIVTIAALSTLAAAVIALSLARIDGRRDEYTLVSVGAKPRTQRLIAFWQALVVAGFGSIIGGALALVPSAALAYANTILFAPPWLALVTSVLGVPVVIALVALVLRRVPRAAAPDRSLVG